MKVVGGIQAVREALRAAPEKVRKIFVVQGPLDSRKREILTLARSQGVPVYRETKARIGRVRGEDAHQGVVAELTEISWMSLETLIAEAPDPALLLVLDQVEDPRNLGAAVRAADGAGVHGVVMPERKTAPPSQVAIAASGGALFHARMARVTNLSNALAKLKEEGLWVVGLSPDARDPWYSFDYTVPLAVVVGSEGKGLRKRVAATCDALVSLPQLGEIGSLNLSVAAGVILYEVVRQRSAGDRS